MKKIMSIGENKMKTFQEFLDRIKSDKEFADKITKILKEKKASSLDGNEDLLITIAAEFGYEVKKEELDESIKEYSSHLSEEELGKVSGGTWPLATIVVAVAYTLDAKYDYIPSLPQ